jgi:hypothetical protein
MPELPQTAILTDNSPRPKQGNYENETYRGYKHKDMANLPDAQEHGETAAFVLELGTKCRWLISCMLWPAPVPTGRTTEAKRRTTTGNRTLIVQPKESSCVLLHPNSVCETSEAVIISVQGHISQTASVYTKYSVITHFSVERSWNWSPLMSVEENKVIMQQRH